MNKSWPIDKWIECLQEVGGFVADHRVYTELHRMPIIQKLHDMGLLHIYHTYKYYEPYNKTVYKAYITEEGEKELALYALEGLCTYQQKKS
jgi:hypothetical protein